MSATQHYVRLTAEAYLRPDRKSIPNRIIAAFTREVTYGMDCKPYLPLVLAGQSNLIDKLMYPGCMPLAFRVVAKSHFVGTERDQMQVYISHHLAIGVKRMLFEETTVTAIHQGSGGIFRKANNLARGALVAAAMRKKTISADHVHLAVSKIF